MVKKSYNPGKLWPIIQITVGLIKKNKELLDNPEYLKATLQRNIEELCHIEKCANCGASMIEYVFEFDCLDAIMLLRMGREVNARLATGMTFGAANQVPVQKLEGATYAMKSRTTQMSKLGLIAQLKGANGARVPGVWVVTKRGFDALKGRPVPKNVQVWRNRIQSRTSEMTTLAEAFRSHTAKVEDTLRKGKQPKTDYREQTVGYSPSEWYHIAGVHEGNLI